MHNFCLMFCVSFWGWGLSTTFLPQGSEFRTFFVPGGSIRPFKSWPGGGGGGEMVRLGFDSYIMHTMTTHSFSIT